MGLDLLDIVFRLEKAFSIKINREDFDQMLAGRSLKNLTAGEIYDYIASRLHDRWPRTSGESFTECDVYCAVCGYNLRGLTIDRACPECGTPMQFEAHLWLASVRCSKTRLGLRQTVFGAIRGWYRTSVQACDWNGRTSS
jgi:hypothetical protein